MKKAFLLATLLFASFHLPAQDLSKAQWICAPRAEAQGSMPVFLRVIKFAKPVRNAIIASSALGAYTLSANGSDIDDEELKPGWTDFRKEVFSHTSRISSSLLKGDTLRIEAQLSNGWWKGGITRGVYGDEKPHAFICSVKVDYKDGTSEEFATNPSWLCATDGPLLMGDIYNGEDYDARKTPSHWLPAQIYSHSAPRIIPAYGPAVNIRSKALWRYPKSMTIYEGSEHTGTTYGKIHVVSTYTTPSLRLKKGQTLLVDFGQNMVGWIDFTMRGKAGTTLTWTFGEMLNYNGDAARLDQGPGGSMWTYNLRSARATINYTMQGDKAEHYHPRHTFFGFRYAELVATEDCELLSLTGQVVGSDIEEWGSFQCSNSDLNQLYSNVRWGQRGNFLSIPTDCPQRDERLGWTGDTQIFSTTALYNSNAKDFYRKWMGDMRASQREDGAYPETAPFANMWGYGTSAWGDAGVIVPYNVFRMTGDTTIIRENYHSMQRWIDFCASQREGEWTHIGAEPKTGDWLAYKEVEPRYVSYAYFAYSAHLMREMSNLLKEHEQADKYTRLNKEIRDEFHRRYITNDEINTGTDTQTAYLLFLRFGLWKNEKQYNLAKESLRKNIEANGYKLSTGFVGTGILMETLTECGMSDLAYRLLLQRENPSWLYSIDQGATTIWERWDSYTQAEGFHKHEWNMNSFNHYSYGAVAGWFYSTILGIRPYEPGFKSVILHPVFGGGLTWAKGGTMTPYGRIDVEWKQQKDGTYRYTVTLPKGVEARLTANETNKPIVGTGKKQHFIL